LSEKHRMKKEERLVVLEWMVEVEEHIVNMKDLNEKLDQPPAGIRPLPGLEIHEDGLACELGTEDVPCPYVVRTDRMMRNHCASSHQWPNPNSREADFGGDPRIIGKPWREGVHCQRFFTQGQKRWYFEVASVAQTDSQIDVSGTGQTKSTDRLEKPALERWIRYTAELRRNGDGRVNEMGRFDTNGWLSVVGWPTHLAGFEPEKIRQYARLPDAQGEEILALMCQSFESLITRAIVTVEGVSRWTR
jgi:hypothetical protein